MKGAIYLFGMRVRDFLFVRIRPIAALTLGCLGKLMGAIGASAWHVRFILAASRLSDSRWFSKDVRAVLSAEHATLASLVSSNLKKDEVVGRSLILAPPLLENGNVRRKGVLVVTFTGTCGAAFNGLRHSGKLAHFHVVLEPSWSGLADPDVLVWATSGDKTIVQAAESRDREMIRDLGSSLVAVPWSAGDWIDPRRFHPIADCHKKYAAVCVGNLSWYKRVHVYLKSIRKAVDKDPNLRVALVVATWGSHSESTLRAAVQVLGLGKSIDIYRDVDSATLNRIYNESSCCVLTSLKEGGNRAIYEAMFAGTPAVVLEPNVGVNKEYLCGPQGVAVPEKELAKAILQYSSLRQSTAVREWAMQNISPQATTAKLADQLAELFPDEDWKPEDLFAKSNSPEIGYWPGPPALEQGGSIEGLDVSCYL